MFNSVQKSKNKDNVSSIRPAKQPAGRERLHHFDVEVGKAKAAVDEFEQRIERLEGIIADADQAHRALQQNIEGDNGKSLADYSAGKVEADSHIAKLVLAADNGKRAASAAQAALPTARDALENAKGQVLELGEQRAKELNRVLTMLADEDVRKYQAAFETLGRLHDQLVGYAQTCESNQGDIFLIQEPLKANRFASPSSGNSDADPFLRHRISDLTVSESARTWQTVRDRLAADANADLSDLI